MDQTLPLLTIICPVFNEQDSIPVFYQRLQSALEPLRERYRFELLFTNNRSQDNTLSIIQNLRTLDNSIQVLTLSRNFGYQASVLCGMSYAQGDAMMTIDVDCEDPPEMIPTFIEHWERGYDIVYGIRGNRPESHLIVSMRRLFYRLLRFTADTDIIVDMAEFALIGSHVRDEIINNKSTFPFLRTEIGYVGFEKFGIPYDRQARVQGKSKYNLWRMALFAVGGILSSSTFPMRGSIYLLPFVIVANLLVLIYDMLSNTPLLFKSIIITNFIYVIVLLTLHGLYLARIYKNGVSRPVFIIDWKRSAYNYLIAQNRPL
jgi:polyisoprenyl-phosphate glycosyltransferase